MKLRDLDLEKKVETHYRIFGYEKQNYLHDLLEEHFGRCFPIFDDEDNDEPLPERIGDIPQEDER